MAKTKAEKEILAKENSENQINEDPAIIKEENSQKYSYEELLDIIGTLSREVNSLKQNQNINSANSNSGLNDVLSLLANRKSDKEISIVHNRELTGGLTTHIELTNTIIDFRHIGETRLLSWQQFEECASKYRTFFDAQIIVVDKNYADVADQYNLPCLAKTHALTQKDLISLGSMNPSKLETFVEGLNDKEKETVFSYWLGKCYTKEKDYYDRHKMDIMNRLSNGLFDNILLVMNGEGRNIPTSK